MNNLILETDSYKTSMYRQYPPGTEKVHSYIESRGGLGKVRFFGLQAFLKTLRPITEADIDEAESVITAHGLPFNREGWEYILKEHGGHLPVKIMAVPEGDVYQSREVLVSVENTDPKCFWLTTYLETVLLQAVWYMSTVATISWNARNTILDALRFSGDESTIDFKLHDFGFRGVSSRESAALGGMAHLLNFKGTDTIPALVAAQRFYGADMAGFSIPAMEHSTVTAWTEKGEAKAFANMINEYGKEGALLACVSDSYDLTNAVQNIWGQKLRQKVIDSGATVVIRPDSGYPPEVVVETVMGLDAHYGSTQNDKGFDVLNHVRVIQGDGIDNEMIGQILDRLHANGYSADNIAFGMGGALLQHCDRDWGRWAMKCSAIKVNGNWRDVYKAPKTDVSKTSKRGRFLLPVVWENGRFVQEYTWDDVRNAGIR